MFSPFKNAPTYVLPSLEHEITLVNLAAIVYPFLEHTDYL